jgi:uncharacterized membrane protein (UPF0127 family)
MFSRLAALLLVTTLVACSDGAQHGGAEAGRVAVGVGDALTVQAELALTPEQRQLGLGQRDALDDGAGMLFVFVEPDDYTFCMCGMRFPLDFIWIGSDLRVVNLSTDVPPPAETNGETRNIVPAQPVLYVLEVNAGAVAEAGVEVGDAVTFDPEVSPGDAS